MSQRLIFILACVFGLSVCAAAQSKNITNADLEKFKEKRMRAEREYRENYEKLGMPSPAELARSEERKRLENARLAERLRVERLQEERNQALREQAEAQAAAANNLYAQPVVRRTYLQTNYGYAPFGYYNFPNGSRDYYWNQRNHGNYNIQRSGYTYGSGGFYYDNRSRYGNQLPPIRPPRPIQPPK